jgi:hypothetical protein
LKKPSGLFGILFTKFEKASFNCFFSALESSSFWPFLSIPVTRVTENWPSFFCITEAINLFPFESSISTTCTETLAVSASAACVSTVAASTSVTSSGFLTDLSFLAGAERFFCFRSILRSDSS